MITLPSLKRLPAVARHAANARPGSRRGWDAQAHWLRLEYADPRPVERALNRLSRHTDRIGLRWRVTMLYAGLSNRVLAGVLADMAADWGFEVRLEPAALPAPLETGYFVPAVKLAGRAGEAVVDGYIVRERLFVLDPGQRPGWGMMTFPAPSRSEPAFAGTWQLPPAAFPSYSQNDCYHDPIYRAEQAREGGEGEGGEGE